MIELRLPNDFDEGLWESKGFLPKAELLIDGRRFYVNFYDPVRLSQDAAAATEGGKIFFEENLIVVERISRPVLDAAADWLVRTGGLTRLVEAK